MGRKENADALENHLRQFNSICWYPSAGWDFRPLMYMSRAWAKRNGWKEDRFPDCFVMTNACGDELDEAFFSSPEPELFADYRTCITATEVKELPRISLRRNPELAYDACKMLCPNQPHDFYQHYGRVVAMKVHVHSKQLGDWDTNLVYAIAENATFAVDFILKHALKMDYVYRAHFGYMWSPDAAGSRSTGMFLQKLLHRMGTRYYVSDRDEQFIHSIDAAEIVYQQEIGNAAADLTQVATILSGPRRTNRYYEYGLGVYRVEAGEHRDALPYLPEDIPFMYMRYASIWGPRASASMSMTDCLREMVNYYCHTEKIRTYTEFLLQGILPHDLLPFPVWVRKGEERFIEDRGVSLAEYYYCSKPLCLDDGTVLFLRSKWTYIDFLTLLGKLQEKGMVAIPDWHGYPLRK